MSTRMTFDPKGGRSSCQQGDGELHAPRNSPSQNCCSLSRETSKSISHSSVVLVGRVVSLHSSRLAPVLSSSGGCSGAERKRSQGWCGGDAGEEESEQNEVMERDGDGSGQLGRRGSCGDPPAWGFPYVIRQHPPGGTACLPGGIAGRHKLHEGVQWQGEPTCFLGRGYYCLHLLLYTTSSLARSPGYYRSPYISLVFPSQLEK